MGYSCFGNQPKQDINVRVEFECTPIRHLAIQCPHCKNWFHASDVTPTWVEFSYQIELTEYYCPICEKEINSRGAKNNFHIQEVSSSAECYKDCKEKKVTWE